MNPFLAKSPTVDPSVYVAQGAIILGDVNIGRGSSVWFNSVIRGDVAPIEIGEHTNIQDLSMVHVSTGLACKIGSFVTVGHSCIVHACTVGDFVLVGMGAVILDGAVISDHVLIGAGSVITPKTVIPPRKKVLGHPAKIVGDLTDGEMEELKRSAERYMRLSSEYRALQ